MILSSEERAPIEQLIAGLLVREVDEETWLRLRDESIIRFFERSQPAFRSWIGEEPVAARLDEMREEFARLFLVPGGVPPYASAWLEGDRERLANDLSTFVRATLETLGREPIEAEPWGQLPLDHLALLLDLVVAATAIDSDARAADDVGLATNEGAPSSPAESSPREKAALAPHLRGELLGPWVAKFGETLEERATSPLYRGIGAVLAALHRSSAGAESQERRLNRYAATSLS